MTVRILCIALLLSIFGSALGAQPSDIEKMFNQGNEAYAK